MATNIAEMQDGIRQELVALLLEKIETDRYPSTTMLDIVESLAGPEELPMFAEILMRKISDDQFPSMDLIRRVQGLG